MEEVITVGKRITLNSGSLGDRGISLSVDKDTVKIYLSDEKTPRASLRWEYQGSCIYLRRAGNKEIEGSLETKDGTALLFLER